MENKNNIATKVIALGGLGEVGKNMYIVEHNDEILIIDAGVMFPEDNLLGVDYVIQDVTYLKKNANKIKGLFITHGHEDHIGGIPFLLQAINIPVIYTPKIAKDLIEKKLVERNIKYDNYQIITPDFNVKTKYFDISFINTTHSIPDSFAIVIKTPNGTIFETGDFKFDLTPVGPMADIHKMAKIGSEGVTLLLSDSTNALTSGYSKSESAVDGTLNDMISKHHGRVIIATFASNIYRIKHIVESCKKYGRKIIVFGRSMDNSIELALNNGLINDKSMFIDANDAKSLKRNEICILCTGSQGEPLAALSRIANGQHKQISLLGDDLVIFSSSPIPGNAESINKIINKLYLKGVRVFTNSEFSDVHTSGHAKEEELKYLVKAKAGDEEARNILIEHNLRLVVFLAKKYENTTYDIEDLVSIGSIGLIKGINTYKIDKNIKLATYASRCISNEILMFLRKNKRKRAEVSLEDALNYDAEGNELHLEDILGTDENLVPNEYEKQVDKEVLAKEIEGLPDRDKEIMTLRYGLNNTKEYTQKEVAVMLGISQSYISRIEKKVIRKLKQIMVK